MTWYADLSLCDYYGAEAADKLRAVGWLEPGRPYSTGEVSEEFFEKLCELLANPWTPVCWLGVHSCEFCRFTGGGTTVGFKGYEVRGVSARDLFVPGEDFLYVAPESIAHYIDAHGYCPPDEFCRAVMRCPTMRSAEYLRSILKNGPRSLAGGKPKR